ncbi:MAG TPA: ABC transporter permease [bacterium]|nr:ABC transporter permease [bacterium]
MIEVVVDGERSDLAGCLRELWAYREVVWAFAERDTRVKYKQAVLGVAWAVLQPLVFLGVFIVVFGRVAHINTGNVPYGALALAALVPWFFVQSSVSFGAQTLLRDSALVRKIYFPREAPVLGAVLSSSLDFCIGLTLVLILEPFLGGRLSWYMFLAIPLWAILAVQVTGVVMAFSALNVYYRDIRYVIPLAMQLWMYATPVAYPLEVVQGRWRTLYVVANPATGVIDGFHRVLARGLPPDPRLLALSTVEAVAIACVGYWLFKRMEPGFADAV